MVEIPGAEGVVLVYNRFQEEEKLAQIKRWKEGEEYEAKPLACIPEMDCILYSRCIVCRRNEDGSYASLEDEDYGTFMGYLSV